VATKTPPSNGRKGELIAKRYQLEELIGTGGQGEVYRARDLYDKEWVAVKVLRGSPDPAVRERMFREAYAMAVLTGTSAVRVMDQQWAEDGSMCLVMELLHGRDLASELEQRDARGERVSVAEVLAWFAPVVSTLEAAHDRGIAHRDLKPANVFLVDEAHGGGVRVLDFGFAKLLRAPAITAAGVVAGSPSYLAPEAWTAISGGTPPDHRADLYALAVMIFRCLAGRLPFEGTDVVQLYKAVTAGPRPSLCAHRPELPPEVDDWVAQALAIDPSQRFFRARGMWTALERVLRT
jgi:serine/threonine-protein kinase